MSSLVSRLSAASQRRVLRVMLPSLNLSCQLKRTRNVARLCALVAAAEQDDDRVAAADEIHPIARAVVDPHLRHAAAHWPHVTGIAEREAADANRDPGARLAVPQPGKPIAEDIGLPDLDHAALSLIRDSKSRLRLPCRARGMFLRAIAICVTWRNERVANCARRR